jgi:hypothetical protein
MKTRIIFFVLVFVMFIGGVMYVGGWRGDGCLNSVKSESDLLTWCDLFSVVDADTREPINASVFHVLISRYDEGVTKGVSVKSLGRGQCVICWRAKKRSTANFGFYAKGYELEYVSSGGDPVEESPFAFDYLASGRLICLKKTSDSLPFSEVKLISESRCGGKLECAIRTGENGEAVYFYTSPDWMMQERSSLNVERKTDEQ